LKWLGENRLTLVEHMETYQPSCRPDLEWWVMVYILLDFTAVVKKALKSIRDLITLVSEQTDVFQKLVGTLRSEGYVRGPMVAGDVIQEAEDRYINEPYFAFEEDSIEFIRNRDIFVVESMGQLRDAKPNQYLEILRCVRVMYVDAVVGIKKIMIERDNSNRGTSQLPPVLPKELSHMSVATFHELVVLQRGRLREFYSEADILKLEEEFKTYLAQLRDEPKFKEIVLGTNGTDFESAWSLIKAAYPFMCQFFGGLASVFPGTSTVESDFSITGFEKGDYRQARTNFSLEGIMQCKQFETLGQIMALVNGNNL